MSRSKFRRVPIQMNNTKLPEQKVFSSIPLVCPFQGCQLTLSESGESYIGDSGCCQYPIIKGIPRFVESSAYAKAFGEQWNTYRSTQLDSVTGTTLSADRLTRALGGDMGIVRGKIVLEAGCGAGRFTELLLEAGAMVFAVDLSEAVDANLKNCGAADGYFVCQADLRDLPVSPGQFDIVLCLGVIQHTPDPEKAINTLSKHVKPGGLLVIDHYSETYPVGVGRTFLRWFLLKRSPQFTLRFCKGLCWLIWPIHRLAFQFYKVRGLWRIYEILLKISPISDYQKNRSELGPELLYEWAVLDTHDSLTDKYKHIRTPAQIRQALEDCEMEKIDCYRGGNGVEARARRSGRVYD